MNERIRELREQAWTLVSNEERDRGELYEVREQWERCDQKFAELIVRECADLFVDRRYMVLNPLEPFADERVRVMKAHDKDTVKTIKKHFGVE